MYILYLFISLNLMWFIFSGFTSAYFLSLGVISSIFALYIAERMTRVSKKQSSPLYINFEGIRYFIWLFKEIIISSIGVVRIIWSRDFEIDTTMKKISTSQKTDLGRTTYANSITLTPGTLCVDVEKKQLKVHALNKKSIADLELGHMDERIYKVVGSRK